VKNVCGSGAEHVRHIKESKMKMNRPATGWSIPVAGRRRRWPKFPWPRGVWQSISVPVMARTIGFCLKEPFDFMSRLVSSAGTIEGVCRHIEPQNPLVPVWGTNWDKWVLTNQDLWVSYDWADSRRRGQAFCPGPEYGRDQRGVTKGLFSTSVTYIFSMAKWE
jgi:hypothetical protein